MKQKKKNGFFTFLCSFVPGAAEMYMGFMRTGLSLMTVFFLCIALPAIFGGSDIFLGFAFIAYAYSFFHARNLWALNDEEFADVKDDFVWSEYNKIKLITLPSQKTKRLFAWLLIIAGVSLLWNNLHGLMRRFLPDMLYGIIASFAGRLPGILVSVLIILLGIKLIRGKKERLILAEKEANEQSNESD